MKIIAFMNQKGGVGKTTSAFNCAAALRLLKKKVLIIDLDPQANLTKSFGLEVEESKRTVFEFLKKECPFADAVHRKLEIDVIPSAIKLAGAELELSSEAGREFILKDCLGKHIRKYDYVLMDCPPALGTLTLNAMTAATDILIVLKTDNYSIFGTADLMRTIGVVQDRLNPKVRISGMIATNYDARNNLDKASLDYFKTKFPNLLFKTVIRQNVDLRESPAQHLDIFSYDPKSHGADDYLKLTRELIERSAS